MVPEMSTSTEALEPTTPSQAVTRFFAERVRVVDPKMGNETSKPEMRERVIAYVESAVFDRLCTFWEVKTFNEIEEIEFVFKPIEKGSKTYVLVTPYPLVKSIEYCFRGARLQLTGPLHQLAITDDSYVLRVYRGLVIFAGEVLWPAPTK